MFDFKLGQRLSAGGFVSNQYRPFINYTWSTIPIVDDYVTDGKELATNGDFSDGLTGWIPRRAILSVVNGKLNIEGDERTNSNASQTLSGLVVGQTYKLSFDIFQLTSTNYTVRVDNVNVLNKVTDYGYGKGFTFIYTGSSMYLSFYTDYAAVAETMQIDNVSVQKVIQKPFNRYFKDSGKSPKKHLPMQSGQGVKFNGVDQSVAVDIQLTTEFSLMFSGNFDNYVLGDGSSYKNYISIRVGFIRAIIGGKLYDFNISINKVTSNVAVIADANNISIYVDAVLKEVQQRKTDTHPISYYNIGKQGSTNSSGVLGNIIAINKALTPEQVRYQYENPETFLYREDGILKSKLLHQAEIDNVVAYLPMCERDGYVRDLVSYGEGIEALVNTTFDTDLNGWNVNGVSRGTYTIDNGMAKIVNDGTDSYPNISQDINLVEGTSYLVGFKVDLGTAEAFQLRIYVSGGENLEYTITKSGRYEVAYKANITSSALFLCYLWETGQTGHECWVDEVSLRELSGTYPIDNYTTSCRTEAQNLATGLQTTKLLRDTLGVPYGLGSYEMNAIDTKPALPLDMTDTELWGDGTDGFVIEMVIKRQIPTTLQYLLYTAGGMFVRFQNSKVECLLYGDTNIGVYVSADNNFHHVVFEVTATEIVGILDGVVGTPKAHSFTPSGRNFKDSVQPSPTGSMPMFKMWYGNETRKYDRTKSWELAELLMAKEYGWLLDSDGRVVLDANGDYIIVGGIEGYVTTNGTSYTTTDGNVL